MHFKKPPFTISLNRVLLYTGKHVEQPEDQKSKSKCEDKLEVIGTPFPPLNGSQQTAIRSALAQPFTVIQGPPGTCIDRNKHIFKK